VPTPVLTHFHFFPSPSQKDLVVSVSEQGHSPKCPLPGTLHASCVGEELLELPLENSSCLALFTVVWELVLLQRSTTSLSISAISCSGISSGTEANIEEVSVICGSTFHTSQEDILLLPEKIHVTNSKNGNACKQVCI